MARTVTAIMALAIVIFAVMATTGASPAASTDLQDQVHLLRGQLQALMDQRHQDLQLVKTLRDEVETAKRTLKRIRNLEVRIEWTEAGLTEARGQLGELGAALHKTASIPAALSSLQAASNNLQNDLQALSKQVEANKPNSLPVHHEPQNPVENEILKLNMDVDSAALRGRHGRGLRKRLEALENSVGRGPKSIQSRLAKVESESGGVHKSMLELLESVESVESRVETSIPALQREVSSTELSLAKTIQQQAIIKEEQENQRATVKALSVGISTLQDKLDKISHRGAADSTTPPPPSSKEGVVKALGELVGQYTRLVSKLPHECGTGMEGVELVRAGGEGDPVMIGCQEGWSLVQRRKDGSVQFNRSWQEYAEGFGSPSGEFWIGNEALHRLTKDRKMKLRVDMVDIYGKFWVAEYSEFGVGSREDGFRLKVGGYKGNASDALDYQNKMQFSAKDSDRDISNTHCAANYEGGWWFSHCQHANLNGRYNLGLTWFQAAKNEWIAVAQSTMRIAPSEV